MTTGRDRSRGDDDQPARHTVGYATPRSYGEIFSPPHSQAADHQTEKNVVLIRPLSRLTWAWPSPTSLSAVRKTGAAAGRVYDQRQSGERAGNARARRDRDGPGATALRTSITVRHAHRFDQDLFSASRMVSSLTGLSVQRNKAIVGQNAFCP